MVERSTPFQRKVEFLLKFAPVTIRLKPDPPAVATFGVNESITGAGLAGGVMAKVKLFDCGKVEP